MRMGSNEQLTPPATPRLNIDSDKPCYSSVETEMGEVVQKISQGTKVFKVRFINIKLGVREGAEACDNVQRKKQIGASGAIIPVCACLGVCVSMC